MNQAHKNTLIEVVTKYHNKVEFKEVKLKADGFGLEVVQYTPSVQLIKKEPLKNNRDKLKLINFGS